MTLLKTEFLAVGQGNCELIQLVDEEDEDIINYLALVDCGRNGGGMPSAQMRKQYNIIRDAMKKRADTEKNVVTGLESTTHLLDCLIVTHSDIDHISSFTKGQLFKNLQRSPDAIKYISSKQVGGAAGLENYFIDIYEQSKTEYNNNCSLRCIKRWTKEIESERRGVLTAPNGDPEDSEVFSDATFVFNEDVQYEDMLISYNIDHNLHYMTFPFENPNRKRTVKYYGKERTEIYNEDGSFHILNIDSLILYYEFLSNTENVMKVSFGIEGEEIVSDYTGESVLRIDVFSDISVSNAWKPAASFSAHIYYSDMDTKYEDTVKDSDIDVQVTSLEQILEKTNNGFVNALELLLQRLSGSGVNNAVYDDLVEQLLSHHDARYIFYSEHSVETLTVYTVEQINNFASETTNADTLLIGEMFWGGRNKEYGVKAQGIRNAISDYGCSTLKTLAEGNIGIPSHPDPERFFVGMCIAPGKVFYNKPGNIDMTLINTKGVETDENDRSIMTVFLDWYTQCKVFLPADATRVSMQYYIEYMHIKYSELIPHEIYCLLAAPHHGSWVTCEENDPDEKPIFERFCDLVHPKYIVISAGYNNKFGHPHSSFANLADSLLPLQVNEHEVYINSHDSSDQGFYLAETSKGLYTSAYSEKSLNLEFGYYNHIFKNYLHLSQMVMGLLSPTPLQQQDQETNSKAINSPMFQFVFEQ